MRAANSRVQSSQLQRSLSFLYGKATVCGQNDIKNERNSFPPITSSLARRTSKNLKPTLSAGQLRRATISSLPKGYDSFRAPVERQQRHQIKKEFTFMSPDITYPELPLLQDISEPSNSPDSGEGASSVRTLSDVTSATDHDVGAELTPRSPSVAKRDRNKDNSSQHLLDTSNPELVATVLRKSFGSITSIELKTEDEDSHIDNEDHKPIQSEPTVQHQNSNEEAITKNKSSKDKQSEREKTTSGHSRRDGEVRDLHYREGKCGWGIGIYQLAGESDEDWKRRQERQETECQTSTGETQEVTS